MANDAGANVEHNFSCFVEQRTRTALVSATRSRSLAMGAVGSNDHNLRVSFFFKALSFISEALQEFEVN